MILRIPLEFCSWECWEEFGNSFATYVFDNAWSWAGRHSTGPQWWQSFFGVTATFGWGQIHHQHPLFNSSNGPSVDLARQCHLQSFAWVPRWQAGSNRWLMNWGATTCLSTRLGDGMLDGGNSIWSNFTQDLKVEVLSLDDFAYKFLCVFEQIWPMGNNLHLANCETPRRVKLTWPDNLTQALVPWWIHTWRIPCMGTSEHNHTIIISQYLHKNIGHSKNLQRLQDDLNISRGLDVSVNIVCSARCTPDSTGPGN